MKRLRLVYEHPGVPDEVAEEWQKQLDGSRLERGDLMIHGPRSPRPEGGYEWRGDASLVDVIVSDE